MQLSVEVSKTRNWEPALTYLSIVLLGLAGHASMGIKPVLLGSYVNYLGFSPEQAGYVLSSEMTATAISTLGIALKIKYWNRLIVALAAISTILIGNLLSLLATDVVGLSAIRFITGVGHGAAIATMVAAIAGTSQPERLSGLYTISAMACASVFAFTIPQFQEAIGINGLYLIMGLIVLPCMLFIKFFPRYAPKTNDNAEKTQNPTGDIDYKLVGLSLFACAFYYIGVGGFWPYAEQIGRAVGLSYKAAIEVVGYATIASIFGAITAVVLGSRLGRLLPLAFCLVMQTLVLIGLILFPESHSMYFLATLIYMYCWLMFFPYLLGFMSRLDTYGRANGLLIAINAMGYAVGPAIAAYLTSLGSGQSGDNIDNVIWLGIFCFIPSFLILAAVKKYEGSAKQRIEKSNNFSNKGF